MKTWTKAEEDGLRELYGSMTAEELAVRFGTTKGAIYQKVHKLGLHKEHPCKIRLPDGDILWLRLNFPHIATKLCAWRLGISPRSVVRIARSLGLEKTTQFMKECQAFSARKGAETNPRMLKGWYSPNLQKGEKHKFQKQNH